MTGFSHLKFKKSDLDKIPERERALLILLAHACNETSVLLKAMLFSIQSEDAEKELFTQGSVTNILTFQKLLCSKLNEAMKLIFDQKKGKPIIASCEASLDENTKTALTRLQGYWTGSKFDKSLLWMIRDGFGSHYGLDDVEQAYRSFPADDRDLDIYLSDTGLLNTLYFFAERIVGYSMLRRIDNDDAKALKKIQVQTTLIANDLVEFVSGYMVTCLKRYVSDWEIREPYDEFVITDLEKFESIFFPYFLDLRLSDKP